ncbi:MAG: hypothetical protein NVS4B12_15110 [Ktedonobacteraceae bacterium]
MRTLLPILKTTFKYWLLIAIVIVGFYFSMYAVIQQVLRQGADDPQIQMAEDSAAKLAAGQSVQDVVPAGKVDIATSIAPYMIIFDANGTPIASSGQLNGQTPTIPSGVFDFVRRNGEDRITWQPQDGVRSAITVTQFKGASTGFVLAGRSLREVEKREDNILQLLNIGWIGMLIITLPVTALVFRKPLLKE